MANHKLTLLSSSELKLEPPANFCLNSNGNCMVLNNSSEVTAFELMYCCDSILLVPYSIKQLKVSQFKPISEIIKGFDLVQIYENSTVQESQELACDVIYTADCAVEPLKAKVLQVDIIPKNNENICCVLTNYGWCEFLKKNVVTGEWEPMNINLTNILLTKVFPPNQSPTKINTFDNFKKFADIFIITSFTISLRDNEMIIYLGTAASYVIALKYNETSSTFEPYCKLKTSLNRIICLTVCNNLILAGCDRGKVTLLKINFNTISLQELEYLWSVTDGMSCQKAAFSYSKVHRSYFVAFCKAAHVLAFRLDNEGAVESSSTLYISGVKITGIESINENEFIITTITGAVKHIRIVCPSKEEIYCEVQSVHHDFDSTNYQILGVAASATKHLWSFLLFRNKEYVHRSKYSATTAFLNTCKLSSRDSFLKLTNTNFRNMDLAQDLIVAVSLDIFNNKDNDKYMEYLNLENINIPSEMNDMFLQRLQIKLMVTRILAKHQLVKYKKIKEQTRIELLILEPVLQLLHILERMSFLQELNFKQIKFSKFQEQALTCMQLQFNQLLDSISIITNDETTLEFCKVPQKFAEYFQNKMKFTLKFDKPCLSTQAEYCTICNSSIDSFKICKQNHNFSRCSISCTQISIFETKHCPFCNALARNDDEANLEELYAPGDCVTCIYCRFLFRQYEMKFITK